MSVIDEILEYLEDGGWHTAIEIEKKFFLTNNTVYAIINFLSKYGFVELDDKNLKVKACVNAGLDKKYLKLKVGVAQ